MEYEIEDEAIVGVIDEETVRNSFLTVCGENIQLLVTKGGAYYNMYIIHDIYQKEPMNNLYLQDDVGHGVPDDMQCEMRVMEFYLWHKYNKSFSIEYEELDAE